MKSNFFYLIIFFSILPLLSSSCRRDDDPLPDASQEGRNTIGCRINGKVWIAESSDIKSLGVGATFWTDLKALRLGGKISNKSEFNRIIIGVGNFAGKTGEYILSDYSDTVGIEPNISYGLYKVYTPEPITEYATVNNHTGKIRITKYDPVNMIISGTFEFQAQAIGGSDSINITDGRFDLRFTKRSFY